MGVTPTLMQVQLQKQPCPRAAGGLCSVTSSACPLCHPPGWVTSHGTQGWERDHWPSDLETPNRTFAAEVSPPLCTSVKRTQLWFAGGGEKSCQPAALPCYGCTSAALLQLNTHVLPRECPREASPRGSQSGCIHLPAAWLKIKGCLSNTWKALNGRRCRNAKHSIRGVFFLPLANGLEK